VAKDLPHREPDKKLVEMDMEAGELDPQPSKRLNLYFRCMRAKLGGRNTTVIRSASAALRQKKAESDSYSARKTTWDLPDRKQRATHVASRHSKVHLEAPEA
jgi:hypothetical protein